MRLVVVVPHPNVALLGGMPIEDGEVFLAVSFDVAIREQDIGPAVVALAHVFAAPVRRVDRSVPGSIRARVRDGDHGRRRLDDRGVDFAVDRVAHVATQSQVWIVKFLRAPIVVSVAERRNVAQVEGKLVAVERIRGPTKFGFINRAEEQIALVREIRHQPAWIHDGRALVMAWVFFEVIRVECEGDAHLF